MRLSLLSAKEKHLENALYLVVVGVFCQAVCCVKRLHQAPQLALTKKKTWEEKKERKKKQQQLRLRLQLGFQKAPSACNTQLGSSTGRFTCIQGVKRCTCSDFDGLLNNGL